MTFEHFYDPHSLLEGGNTGRLSSWSEIGRLWAIVSTYTYAHIYAFTNNCPLHAHKIEMHIYKVNLLISDLFNVLSDYGETVLQWVKIILIIVV